MTDEREGDSESTWARLTRRKVVQWGIVYVAGAWGFLQGLEYVGDAFGWPAQLRQVAILVVLIGLPIALVIAWYHGDRGEQRVTGAELAIVSLLFVIGGGLFWRYDRAASEDQRDKPAVAKTVQAPSAASNQPSIAVLPFRNRSSDAADAYFVDGIGDDILTRLAQIRALKVISRTSVEEFRNTSLPLKEVAEKLGVKAILEGGVQRAGSRVRINVQLIDTANDAHLWAETFDRDITVENLFAVQSEVAGAVAHALNASLTQGEQVRFNALPTRSLEAWDAYQRGRALMAREKVDLEGAGIEFKRAIAIDPNFVPAIWMYANSLLKRVEQDPRLAPTLLPIADRALARAIEIDPDFAEAYVDSGFLAYLRGDADRAESLYRKAHELSPADSRLGGFLLGMGRVREALPYLRQVAEIDPRDPSRHLHLARALDFTGSFDEAMKHYGAVSQLSPGYDNGALGQADIFAYAKGRIGEGLVKLLRTPSIENGAVSPTEIAAMCADLGDMDCFEHYMARALEMPGGAQAYWPLAVSMHAACNRKDRRAELVHARRLAEARPESDDLLLTVQVQDDLRAGRYRAVRRTLAQAWPEYFTSDPPTVEYQYWRRAQMAAQILLLNGERDRGEELLAAVEARRGDFSALGGWGTGAMQLRAAVARGDEERALEFLTNLVASGWRGHFWRYYRDCDPWLEPIRHAPAFQAAFKIIEQDMARHYARSRREIEARVSARTAKVG